MRKKQSVWLIITFVIIGYAANQYLSEPETSPAQQQATIEQIFQQKQSNVQLEVTGKVIKLLRDDLDGSRHQKFLIKTPEGRTILIVHNIDLAPRINTLEQGDSITVYGEFEWNTKGGLLHWTHHDPAKRHPGGWIKHQNITYQ